MSTGRFSVALPFKTVDPSFGDIRMSALKRLNNMGDSLFKNSKIYKEYNSYMKNYLSNGYLVEISPTFSFDKIYYIPHNFVMNSNSATTQLRAVFDASCKSPPSFSLNDTLFIGQKLQ